MTERLNCTEDSPSLILIFLYPIHLLTLILKRKEGGFPGGSVVKTMPANAGDADSIPGSGRFPGVGNGNPF